jgi:hypothetical protein
VNLKGKLKEKMKKPFKSIALLILLFVILIAGELITPKPIDWGETYSKYHKKPYGNQALYEVLHDIFPNNQLLVSHEPILNTLENNYENERINYILINNFYSLPETDEEKLLEFVADGNCAFIAANNFWGKLMDTLKLETDAMLNIQEDSIYINFSHESLKSEKPYKYKFGRICQKFSKYDSLNTTVLGTNTDGEVIFLKVEFGNGYFLLSTVPLAFTNYNLLYGGNHSYIEKSFSYLPDADLIWDEYYKVGKLEARTPLRFILGDTSLKWAYITAMAFILLYILFKGKRTQRIIPVIEPLKNSTVEFTETVGRLYYQQGDHKNLVDKKIKYYFEHIRSKYNLKTHEVNEEFLKALSGKTGMPYNELKNLFDFLNWLSEKDKINENELHKCNELIENFYAKTTI